MTLRVRKPDKNAIKVGSTLPLNNKLPLNIIIIIEMSHYKLLFFIIYSLIMSSFQDALGHFPRIISHFLDNTNTF